MVAALLLPRLREVGAEVVLLGRADVSAVVSPAELAAKLAGADAIVHLVGTLRGRSRADYLEAHLETTRRLLAAGEAQHVARMVYLSIPGADPLSKNPYLESKGRGEAAVYQSTLAPTVFRIGPVLGPARPISDLIEMARAGRMLLPGGGHARTRPVAVEDVARLLVEALTGDRARGAMLEVGGPAVHEHREIALEVAAALGVRAAVWAVPTAIARGFAWYEVKRHAHPAYSPEGVDIALRDMPVDLGPLGRDFTLPATTMPEAVRRSVAHLVGGAAAGAAGR